MKTTLLLFLALLLSAPAYAQTNDSLSVIFRLEGAGGLIGTSFGGPVGAFRDANGDGTPDLILQRDDNQGNLQALRVLDGRTRAVLWEVPDVTMMIGGLLGGMFGFVDPLGTDIPHALFVVRDDSGVDAGVVLIDPRDNSTAFHTLSTLLGARDLTGDGLEELITFLPDTEQVQVWSIDT